MPRARAAAALALALVAAAAGGTEPPAHPAELDLFVNGVRWGTVLVFLRDGDALVAPTDLDEAGLPSHGAARQLVGTRSLVSLRSLAPEVRFTVDERALALRVSAAPSLFGRTQLDLRPNAAPEGLLRVGEPSGFLNYAAQLRTTGDASAFAELGATVARTFFQTTVSRQPGGAVVRGLSSATWDDVQETRRLSFGDQVATAGPLGGTLLLAGIGARREFSLDPYRIRGPLPSTAGVATTPSTLDVYVNGVLVRQVVVPPGAFEVANLPVTTGSGSVRTVLRDAFGRTQEVDRRYYFASGLLAAGQSDYGYHLGFRRTGFGAESFGYGGPVLLARHRVGLSDALTLGGRVEAGLDFGSAGGSATFATSAGQVEAAGAASVAGGMPGGAASVGYSYLSRRVSAGATLRAQTARYANASLAPSADRAILESSGFVAIPLASRLAVTLEYAAARQRDAGFSDTLSLRADVQLAPSVGLFLTASEQRVPGGSSVLGIFATLSWSVGPGTTAAGSAQAGGIGGSQAAVDVQRSLPAGTGYGYRLHGGAGPLEGAGGVAQLQTEFGRYEAGLDWRGPLAVGSASAAGGIVMIDRALFFSRPVEESYVLVQVPGLAGVRGYLNNQEVGRTDRRGNLLVPGLTAYYANRIGIDPGDVPFRYELRRTEQLVAPPARGGATVRFAATRIQPVTGLLLVGRDGAFTPPRYGEMVLGTPGEPRVSPIGSDGRFYFENVPPGVHRARISDAAGSCGVEIAIPESDAESLELGTIRCTAEVTAAVRPTSP